MLVDLGRVFSITTLATLGDVHCNIRTTQQCCDIEAVLWSESDTNTSSYEKSMAIDEKRHIQHTHQGTRYACCPFSIGCRKYYSKFITTQTGYQVNRTQVALQALTNLL